MWNNGPILKKVVEIAKKYDLHRRDVEVGKGKYVDLCKGSESGPVEAQYHKTVKGPRENILVIGKASEDCPEPEYLTEELDCERLTGDCGPNKNWLRGQGQYPYLHAARLFVLPSRLDDLEGWKEVEGLLGYASER